MNIYFKENYDNVFTELQDRHFLIFGTTLYAQVFYLYCIEKRFVQNIDAFIISDFSKEKRNVHMMHSIPIKDVSWLKKEDQPYSIFMAAKEKTIQEQILSLLDETACDEAFYVSDFVHDVMYSYFVSAFLKDIITRYVVSSDLYEAGATNISDIGSDNFYKYCHRIAVGDCPDTNIFHGTMTLNELHQKQLGDYVSVIASVKEPVSDIKYRIYVARSHFDIALKEEFHTPHSVDIQVGADLTDMEIAECKDNVGDNISIRNRDYCELTALYWIWKNDKENDYVGLCHYRRRFVIDENMMEFVIADRFDAIYLVPNLTDGGMRKEFVERNYFLTPQAWELTGKVLKRIQPEYFDTWLEFEKSYFIIPCNMFIMRKDIFDKYCSWLFMILEEIDKHYLTQGIQCNSRYLGYIAECLTTIYVMKNKNTLKKGYLKMKMLT